MNYLDWGCYLVYVKDCESGYVIGGIIYVDWFDWWGCFNKSDLSGIKMLFFFIDKDFYELGEIVIVILLVFVGGRVLVIFENGLFVI